MQIENPADIASRLAAEHRQRIPFSPLPWATAGNMDLAYAAQDVLVGIFAEAEGATIAGWKVGLTAKKMQSFCGVDSPIAGAILSSRVHCGPIELQLADFGRLGLEVELAVRLGRPLPSDADLTRQSVEASLDRICAAFEIVDDRDADYATLDACSIIADNSWNAGIVLGESRPLEGMPDLQNLGASLSMNGEAVGHAITSDAGGDPLEVVVWLERLLRSRGRRLEVGDWVMTGSIIATQFARRAQEYCFTIEELAPVVVRTSGQN
ncbi:2-keto-4-pentenoate hydratase [Sphingosinicella rhizophila]|uniref:Fumarylacetoacetate hydrolase family protein n=1 Tax=Sphingosinicella rhizophila TaxID=3050082 RepID=A0ABU3QAV7_9SPHN|nr:fumarylacetoacetate hydrolase family protein [Sphingosinicella sp. GR2756]MDT9600543.1 fumarylacetoacetate hydrolase family protein [Sphingosinicella sp. GR2756]